MSRRIISELRTVILAVSMAALVWIAAVREQDPFQTKNYPARLPIKIIAPADDLVLVNSESLPDDIQLKVQAPESVWQSLSSGKIKVWADLSTSPAGSHNIPIQVEINNAQANVIDITPSEINVELEPLATKRLPVTIWIVDDPPLGYYNRLPTTKPISITVKGSAEAVNQVEQIIAKLQLNNSKETVQQQVFLLAYNNNDNIVNNIVLDPPSSIITVPIEQRFGYKDVSAKAVVTGQPAPGYWISSISVEPPTFTLIGGPTVLRDVSGFVETLEIDVSGATENVVKRVPLNLPPGASIVADENADDESGRSALVTVGISAQTGGRTIPVNITVQGVSQSLDWSAAPESVQVILSGPLPILQNLQEGDITVFFDLFGLQAGVHRLQPEIIAPDKIEVTSLIPDTVEFTLSPAVRPTSTGTPTLRPTVTPNSTPTPQETAGPNGKNSTTDILTGTLTNTLKLTRTLLISDLTQ